MYACHCIKRENFSLLDPPHLSASCPLKRIRKGTGRLDGGTAYQVLEKLKQVTCPLHLLYSLTTRHLDLIIDHGLTPKGLLYLLPVIPNTLSLYNSLTVPVRFSTCFQQRISLLPDLAFPPPTHQIPGPASSNPAGKKNENQIVTQQRPRI